jgi:hypothetical protein
LSQDRNMKSAKAKKGHKRGKQSKTSIVNPDHPIPANVARALRSHRESDSAALARKYKIAALARPTAEERKAIIQASGQASVVDIEKLFEIRKKYGARVQEAIRNLPSITIIPSTMDQPGMLPPPPAPKDTTFWWASTAWGGTGPHFTANFDKNGVLHFRGGVGTFGGDLQMFSFGAVAVFELQWDRIPPSPSGWWKSAPFVELFGSISGHTASGSGFLNLTDSWSKCWMFRRQTIRQFGMFTFGSTEHTLGHREVEEKLIDEENKDRWAPFSMPGFQWMPEVIFNLPKVNVSLWAELEVRFDIQLEDGLFQLDPEVSLHTVQWPLVAI